MTQRIYWVPHTRCFLGCAHCHNDSGPGQAARQSLIDAIIAHLPGPDSNYRLEEVLIGGGEALQRGAGTEYLIRAFRRCFPRGSQATIEERRAAGNVILALQSCGLPLADRRGRVRHESVDYWLGLGVDYFQIASSDGFHRGARPEYPWDDLEHNLELYGEAHGIHFLIYGKAAAKLVPSGRVLQNLEELEAQGARLLTAERYCADGWETASHFLSGTNLPYPHCSEVVIDPQGWVHPCCWYELSPRLFDLASTDFATGMEKLRASPICQALDQGDVLRVATMAGIDPDRAEQARSQVGDCGLCRIACSKLSRQPGYAWAQVAPWSEQESTFYRARLGTDVLQQLL